MSTDELKHFVPRFSRIAERRFGASDVTFTESSDPFCVSPVFILEQNEIDIDPDDDEP